MTTLIAILVLLLIPGIMLALSILRRGRKFLWLLAMAGVLLAWLMVYLAGRVLPERIAPQTWQPEILFPLSPSLLLDSTSWLFAIVLVTIMTAVMLTSVTRLGGSPQQDQATMSEPTEAIGASTWFVNSQQSKNWQAWAANLALTSLGLVAVLAGNLLTLLLAWAALDIIEMIILLGRASTGELQGKAVSAFSARIGGSGILLGAGIILWSQGGILDFVSMSPQANILLILAAGLRLTILPAHVPFQQEIPLRIGLDTILILVHTSASLILLTRVADTGIQGINVWILLGFTALVGLVGGIGWLSARDETIGWSYWVVTTSSLIIVSAIQARATTALTWSMAALLLGGLIFLASFRRRFLTPIWIMGIIFLTGLPFTPGWMGSMIIQPAHPPNNPAEILFNIIFGLNFVVVHALLLAGYLKHSLRGIMILSENQQKQVARWIWFLYIPGLIILPLAYLLLGLNNQPDPQQVSLVMWIEGASALGLAAALWYLNTHPKSLSPFLKSGGQYLSLKQLNRPLHQSLRWIFSFVSSITRMISFVLEGEAGVLWAMVILVLILVVLRQ